MKHNIFAEIISCVIAYYYGVVFAIAFIGVANTIVGFPEEQENIDHYIVLPELVITSR